jgi:peptidoglycan/LPS O-acetylase OafA/YrhL
MAAQAASKARLGYTPALDGFRAIAVTLVVTYHAKIPGVRGGPLGVDLFFALSGFLITTLLLQERDTRGTISLGAFYARRGLRLLPALFAVLALNLMYGVFRQGESDAGPTLASLFYVANWVRAFDWFPMDRLGHTWSLSIEEQFYMLWPMVMLFFAHDPKKLLRWLVGCVVVIVIWRAGLHLFGAPVTRTYNGLDTRADTLLCGAIAAILMRDPTWRPVLTSPRLVLFACVAILCVVPVGAWRSPLWPLGGYTLLALASVPIICHLSVGATSSPLVAVLSSRIPVAIGKLSYSLYLWHFPIFFVVEKELPGQRFAVLVTVKLVATVVLATASYFVIERPALRLKKRFERSGPA